MPEIKFSSVLFGWSAHHLVPPSWACSLQVLRGIHGGGVLQYLHMLSIFNTLYQTEIAQNIRSL